ncbi:MAG: permease [Treponema sp.]
MFETFTALSTVFISILLQALPFMLVGALLSSIIHIFIPPHIIIAAFPKKYGLGFATALFAGFFFPVCECASVPLMRGLIKKGVAMPIAVTFMLAAPIVNPISIISTYYAFPQEPSFALYRVYFGLIISFAAGLILMAYPESKYLREYAEELSGKFAQHIPIDTHTTCEFCSCHKTAPHGHAIIAHDHSVMQQKHSLKENYSQKIIELLYHTGNEFFTAGSYLIIGALITAVIRVGVPQNFFRNTSAYPIIGILLMMLFAFVFSACSTSDAFIARSFLNRFSSGAVLAFLVYGPMMDVKNFCMLLSLFKTRFVIELTVIITALNAIGLAILIKIFAIGTI